MCGAAAARRRPPAGFRSPGPVSITGSMPRTGRPTSAPGLGIPAAWSWEALRAHVGQEPDRTQKEWARHFGVSRHCIWHAQRQMGVTQKKRWGTPSVACGNASGICACVSATSAGARCWSTSMKVALNLRLSGGTRMPRGGSGCTA